MISGMTVMLGKSFVHPRPSGLLTTFRSPSFYSRPICHTLNLRCIQIAKKLSVSSVIISSDSSHRFSTLLFHEPSRRKASVVKPHVKPWIKEARFDQLQRSKHFITHSLSSQSADSKGSELPPLYRRKDRVMKKDRAAGGSVTDSHSIFSVDEGFSALSSEPKLVSPNRKHQGAEAGHGEEFRTEQSVNCGSLRTERVICRVEGKQDRSEQKSIAFEQWAVNKLREDGLASLAVIEEMRQTFAPGSQPLDPRLLLSEAELREFESRGNANRSLQPEIINNDSRDEKTSSTPIGQTRPMDGNTTLKRSYEKTSIQKQAEEIKRNSAGSLLVRPLLVKRKTTLPDNWNGPGGTVVLIDKPQGWTSFAVCGKLRHTLKIQKVGHAGTLDPMATGLLIVCLGKATKLADSYQAMTKVYSGIFRLGEDTPSLDADTEVSDTLPWEHIEDEDIEKAKQAFIGDILQSPPMYSAIKVKGERLYAKARRGEEIEVPARPVTVHEFEVNRSPDNRQNLHFRVTCSKGTYIRSLCSDLGRALGSYAHLTALRREKIGSYSVSDAWTVEDLVESYREQNMDFISRSKA